MYEIKYEKRLYLSREINPTRYLHEHRNLSLGIASHDPRSLRNSNSGRKDQRSRDSESYLSSPKISTSRISSCLGKISL